MDSARTWNVLLAWFVAISPYPIAYFFSVWRFCVSSLLLQLTSLSPPSTATINRKWRYLIPLTVCSLLFSRKIVARAFNYTNMAATRSRMQQIGNSAPPVGFVLRGGVGATEFARARSKTFSTWSKGVVNMTLGRLSRQLEFTTVPKMSCRRKSHGREFTPVVVPEQGLHSGTKLRNGIV